MPEIPMLVRDDNPPKPIITGVPPYDSGGIVTYCVDNTTRYTVPAGDPPWTARDELAKAAMQAIITKHPCAREGGGEQPTVEDLATAYGAYAYANAMIVVRKEKP